MSFVLKLFGYCAAGFILAIYYVIAPLMTLYLCVHYLGALVGGIVFAALVAAYFLYRNRYCDTLIPRPWKEV